MDSNFKNNLNKSSDKLSWEVVKCAKMTEWIEMAGMGDWRNFLDSAKLLFDIDIELVKIVKNNSR